MLLGVLLKLSQVLRKRVLCLRSSEFQLVLLFFIIFVIDIKTFFIYTNTVVMLLDVLLKLSHVLRKRVLCLRWSDKPAIRLLKFKITQLLKL